MGEGFPQTDPGIGIGSKEVRLKNIKQQFYLTKFTMMVVVVWQIDNMTTYWDYTIGITPLIE